MCSANTIELKAIKDQFEIGVFAFEEAKNEFEVCNFFVFRKLCHSSIGGKKRICRVTGS
jgi:hypothetical protein